METPASFEQSFKTGREHEQHIVNRFPDRLELLPGTNGDIRIKSTGQFLELKSESRSLDSTPNTFVEVRTSNGKKLGGPWKAKEDNCTYYAVYWPRDERLHIYDTAAFVERAADWCRNHRDDIKNIPTQGHWGVLWTEGYAIPREWFKAILISDVDCR